MINSWFIFLVQSVEDKSKGINQGENIQEGKEETDNKPLTQQNINVDKDDLTPKVNTSQKDQSSPKTKTKKRSEAVDFYTDDQLLITIQKS